MAGLLTKALHKVLKALLKLAAMVAGKLDARERPQGQWCGSDDGAPSVLRETASVDESKTKAS
jgi:hypothetical protein